jgi:hypothetical protein
MNLKARKITASCDSYGLFIPSNQYNYMKMLKFNLLLIVALIATIPTMSFRYTQAPANFSGIWVLDIQRSEMGKAPIPKNGKSKVKISQQPELLILDKSITDSLGKEHNRIDTLSFRGRISNLKVADGQVLHRELKRKWSVDLKVMTIESKFTGENNGNPIEFTGIEVWKLEDEGKILSIVNETVIGENTDRMKLVYSRQ